MKQYNLHKFLLIFQYMIIYDLCKSWSIFCHYAPESYLKKLYFFQVLSLCFFWHLRLHFHLFVQLFYFQVFPLVFFSEISVVTNFQRIVKINSRSVILSLKLSLDFGGIFFNVLYSLGVIPKVALLISAVRIA